MRIVGICRIFLKKLVLIVAAELFLERDKGVHRITVIRVIHPRIIDAVRAVVPAGCPHARHVGRSWEIGAGGLAVGRDARVSGAAHLFRPVIRKYAARITFRRRAKRIAPRRLINEPPIIAAIGQKIS